jgi:hypothetical protein
MITQRNATQRNATIIIVWHFVYSICVFLILKGGGGGGGGGGGHGIVFLCVLASTGTAIDHRFILFYILLYILFYSILYSILFYSILFLL